MASNEEQNRAAMPNIQPGAFSDSLHHIGINEIITLNKYHLLLVLDRMQKQKPKAPSFETAMIPFGVLVAMIVSLLTSSFKDFAGIKADVWQMLVLAVVILSGLATAILFGLWLRNRVCYKEKTPDEIVQEIVQEMENDRERFSSSQKPS